MKIRNKKDCIKYYNYIESKHLDYDGLQVELFKLDKLSMCLLIIYSQYLLKKGIRLDTSDEYVFNGEVTCDLGGADEKTKY